MLLPFALTAVVAASAAPDTAWRVTDNLARPDTLPRLRSVRTASESSYDRTGGNDDGFSGKYSFIRKEGDALVICELKGPGVVQRIWTPTPTDQPLEFYFDGEEKPRITAGFRDLFLGQVPGFPEPLVAHAVGGFASYVPIPYGKSLKIVYRGPVMQFFQINHATLPEGTAVPTFSQDWVRDNAPAFSAARALLGSTDGDITGLMAPPGAALHREPIRKSLAPGKSVTLWQSRKGGRVVGIKLSPAGAIAGKDRAILIKMTWDGSRKPAVLCPAGDFFGASWGDPAMRALLVGSDAGASYCRLPMPYGKSARIELVSERTGGEPIEVTGEVVYADAPLRPDEGRFYAVWHRENPTTVGTPFTYAEAEGHGHVVGVSLQAQGQDGGNTFFFEGDDQTEIDGAMAIHGTGSEDFFNGGWYDVPGRWDTRKSLPLSGCLDYHKHLGRTGGFRWMLGDPVVYHKSLRMCMEHAPERNELITDYVGVTYLYADRPPKGSGEVPAAAARAVTDPKSITFITGWNIPLRAFSMQNCIVQKGEIQVGEARTRALSLVAHHEDVFGPHFVEAYCDIPATGSYRLTAEVATGRDAADIQLFRDEAPAGPRISLAADKPALRKVVLGTLALREGANPVMVKLVGAAPGRDSMRLDLVSLVFERV